MPVLEALLDPRTAMGNIAVARSASGDNIERILEAARGRGISVQRLDPRRITQLSRNGRHDQGVVATVRSPGLAPLAEWLPARVGAARLFLLDGLTNPANVGMIIRTAVAAGLDGVVLPEAGCPEIGPLVVKASAGIALFAPVLTTPTAVDGAGALHDAGVTLVGLAADGPVTLWDLAVDERVAFVFGNETSGLSPAVDERIDVRCSIPLAGGVDSINVAAAAAVVAFELARRLRA